MIRIHLCALKAQEAEKMAWTAKAEAEAMERRHAAELDALEVGLVQHYVQPFGQS